MNVRWSFSRTDHRTVLGVVSHDRTCSASTVPALRHKSGCSSFCKTACSFFFI